MHLRRDVHIDAADAVDEGGESGEVDVNDVRDRDAYQTAHGVGLGSRSARVAGVDLVAIPAGVARNVEHRRAVLPRIDTEEMQRVATRAANTGSGAVPNEQNEVRAR